MSKRLEQHNKEGCSLDPLDIAKITTIERNLYFKDTNYINEDADKIIDAALLYDYEQTILWASKLRNQYKQRVVPQAIMVRAALIRKNPNVQIKDQESFSDMQNLILKRADDVILQFTYYRQVNGSIKNIPNILKRTWAKKLETLSKYELYKYKNKGVGLIDVVKVSHAHSSAIDELIKTGTIELEDKELPWNTLRTEGKSWREIVLTIKQMPHAALLSNIRGICSEIEDEQFISLLLDQLKEGVPTGKLTPYDYYKALKTVSKPFRDKKANKYREIFNKELVIKALKECIKIYCETNLPQINENNLIITTLETHELFGVEIGSDIIKHKHIHLKDIGEIQGEYTNIFVYLPKKEGYENYIAELSKYNSNLFIVLPKLENKVIDIEGYRYTIIAGGYGEEYIYADVVNSIWDAKK